MKFYNCYEEFPRWPWNRNSRAEPKSAKLTRLLGFYMKCSVRLIRLRRSKKLLLRLVSVLNPLFSTLFCCNNRCFILLCSPFSIFNLYAQIIAAARDVQEKTEIYTPYNILPLDAAGASLPIMQFEEVLCLKILIWSMCFIWHCTDIFWLYFSLDQGCCLCTLEHSWLELA